MKMGTIAVPLRYDFTPLLPTCLSDAAPVLQGTRKRNRLNRGEKHVVQLLVLW
jgi:hypothetical protein